MKHVVYVLTGNGDQAENPYFAAQQLSATSLRRHAPDVTITCFCDPPTWQQVCSRPRHTAGLVDRWVECADVTGGPIHRSRWIKTSLRRRLEGPFVYLDCDSVVTGSPDPLFHCPMDLGLTLNAFFPQGPGQFPGWLASHYQRLGWKTPQCYYNGGIFFAADNAATHQFFERWHANWKLSVRGGLVADQPPLNATISELRPSIDQFPETFNFLVGREERVLTREVRILMLLASQGPPWLAGYRDLLQRLHRNDEPTTAEIDQLFPVGMLLPRQPISWRSELQNRWLRYFTQLRTRLGWYDASKG